jgi:hypothetical protein
MYMKTDGAVYSTVEEGEKLVRIEMPAGYVEVQSLLKAIERSIRHRSWKPFVSMDRSYYIAPKSVLATPGKADAVQVKEK